MTGNMGRCWQGLRRAWVGSANWRALLTEILTESSFRRLNFFVFTLPNSDKWQVGMAPMGVATLVPPIKDTRLKTNKR